MEENNSTDMYAASPCRRPIYNCVGNHDCFNVVSVDTVRGLLTVIRIGANTDKMGRVKRTFCFDYQNKRLISEV